MATLWYNNKLACLSSVSMTITGTLFSQIMHQKSATVFSIGPCVAMNPIDPAAE